MITEKVTQITNQLQTLSKKEFQKYLGIGLAIVACLALFADYYVYTKSSASNMQIKRVNENLNKIEQIFTNNKQLDNEEDKIKKIIDDNPKFNMRVYFEDFQKRHKIKPDSDWDPEEGVVIESRGVSYQEISLRTTFKNQTMEKLVTILQEFYKKPIVYLKELEIKAAENKKLDFELTLGTITYKKELEEE